MLTICLCTSCTFMRYTEHIDKSLKSNRIGKTANFVVLPLTNVHVTPPPGMCFFKPKSKYTNISAATAWTNNIKDKILKNYPEHQWEFVPETNSSVHRLTIAAEKASITQKISAKADSGLITFEEQIAINPALVSDFNALSNENTPDYAIVFIRPSLTGEYVTSYSAPMMSSTGFMGGGGFKSEKYYNADIEIQLWHCQTGKLLYNTGVWNKSKGFCFFFSPEDAAISNGTNDLLDKLEQVLSVALLDMQRKSYVHQ